MLDGVQQCLLLTYSELVAVLQNLGFLITTQLSFNNS